MSPPGMSRAEIDYIGPFVKAWAAFNTWYRDASGQTQERGMLQYVKDQPNPVRGRTLSLLGPPGAKTGSRPWSVSDSCSAIP